MSTFLTLLLVSSMSLAGGIVVPEGWTVRVLCTGIPGADGLALSPSGRLFVASETTGRILEVHGADSLSVVLEGLDHPEGIACDAAGRLFVVEDAPSGRLLALGPGGDITVLAEGLRFPEGVAVARDDSALVFFTQSSAEEGALPPFLTSLSGAGEEGTAVIASALWLWSFSGIAVDSAGAVFVCNETSGLPFVGESVVRIDPSDGSMSVFCTGLRACEGLCFSPGGTFPLFVAEEDTGEGRGRVSLVDRLGGTTPFATGFGNIEDVLVDPQGRVFVSEDTGGRILLIERIGTP